jgi:MarR family transcriptional regulator for hemolysin
MKKFDYENSIGFVIYSASKMMQKAFDLDLRNKMGINLIQSKVIFALYVQSGPTQREIADMIGVETSSLVPIIDKLEDDGYVKRKSDAHDRRIKRIYATAKTDSLWDSVMECIIHLRKVSAKDLSEQEIKTALDTVKKITENLTSHLDDSKLSDLKKTKD